MINSFILLNFTYASRRTRYNPTFLMHFLPAANVLTNVTCDKRLIGRLGSRKADIDRLSRIDESESRLIDAISRWATGLDQAPRNHQARDFGHFASSAHRDINRCSRSWRTPAVRDNWIRSGVCSLSHRARAMFLNATSSLRIA